MINDFFNYGSAIAAVIALIITVWQAKLSNKQALFDRRVKVYIDSMSFIEMYKENEKSIIKSIRQKEPFFTIDFDMASLTNNSYLENLMLGFSTPLGDSHKEFLVKIEEIKKLALEIDLLFGKKYSIFLSEFILNYQKLLFNMYQYNIHFEKVKKYAEEYNKSLEESVSHLKEEETRTILINSYAKLKNSYDALNSGDTMRKIKKMIKL
jgi:hypothetical protein